MNNAKLTESLAFVDQFLEGTGKRLEDSLLGACCNGDERAATAIVPELINAWRARRGSETLREAVVGKGADAPTYQVSTIFLQDAFRILTQMPEEDLRFATGIIVAPKTYVMTRLLEFRLSLKSAIAAEGDQQSVNRVLIGLHACSHKLLMTLHSHPGSGANATTPSATDLNLHRRLELGEYPAIGAIFCRKGCVRFFSYKRPFRVSIYGSGIEVMNEEQHIYKLTSLGTI